VTSFPRPEGVIRAQIDAWSGGAPGPWTRDTREEWFVRGTQPGGRNAADPAGLLYSRGCAGWMVDPLKAEVGPSAWDADVQDWLQRARRGVGGAGRHDSATAYFWGESSWGGPLQGPCRVIRPPQPDDDDDDGGNGNGNDGGENGNDGGNGDEGGGNGDEGNQGGGRGNDKKDDDD